MRLSWKRSLKKRMRPKTRSSIRIFRLQALPQTVQRKRPGLANQSILSNCLYTDRRLCPSHPKPRGTAIKVSSIPELRSRMKLLVAAMPGHRRWQALYSLWMSKYSRMEAELQRE